MIKTNWPFTTRVAGAFALGAALLCSASSSYANILVSDSFNVGSGAGEYELGDLIGQGPSTFGWAGNWGTISGGSGTIVTDGLSYTAGGNNLVTSGGKISGVGAHISRNLNTTYGFGGDTPDTIYISFLTNPIVLGAFDAPLQLFEYDEDFGDDGEVRPLYIGLGGAATGSEADNHYRLAVAGNSADLGAAVTGETQLFVLRIDFASGVNDQVWVWRNPSDIGAAAPALGTANATIASADLAFGRIGAAAWGGDHSVDEYRIGTTWESVTPIPEPSTYALLAGLGMLGLVILRRRFRK